MDYSWAILVENSLIHANEYIPWLFPHENPQCNFHWFTHGISYFTWEIHGNIRCTVMHLDVYPLTVTGMPMGGVQLYRTPPL